MLQDEISIEKSAPFVMEMPKDEAQEANAESIQPTLHRDRHLPLTGDNRHLYRDKNSINNHLILPNHGYCLGISLNL